jgi:hypothetical protein
MLKPPIFAALCLALITAAPALAESAGGQKQGASLPNVRLQDKPQTIVSDPAAVPATPEAHMFAGAKPGLGLSSRTYPQEDGTSAIATGIIGSLPVMPGISAGLGIFSVRHEDQKEPEFRRNWSAKSVGPRNRRVAAVGLNVAF